ncbi:MAG: right-handed parallel beta-helix repeat-containing protein [Gemmatimonadota bacterium]|nr:right-handed parallel beta-helix repeat-containing protein [Gemmatimonadota bacterium]
MVTRVSLALLGISLATPPLAEAQNAAKSTNLHTIELRPGLVITRSARITLGVYRLAAPESLDSAVVTVRGDDITVDFSDVTMEGVPPDWDPDLARGVAIRVDGGRNVRIMNARIRGYKVGILARRTKNLSLIDNDLSYNWKPRLYSVIEHESLVDWLSFHHNEKEEWLRYGAGAYLSDVEAGEIRGNAVTQGMNGLMVTRTNGLRIWNNNFSFNSGVGIGLYRSSGNSIMHNRVDYNVRGYSEGFYRRGQDAADLLMYEQSNKNVVAFNSMTHGGDGVFLWAGQSTMDTGEGGANDNLFYLNDFSFAPANGIEATFSRNAFIRNFVEGCEYGMWGGYSYGSRIVGNRFLDNHTGIAIEHGQNNVIVANLFVDDSTGIRVWGDSIAPSGWGYPGHRDTRSNNYRIDGNLFGRGRVGVRAGNTSALSVINNRFMDVDSVAVLRDTTGSSFIDNTTALDAPWPRRFLRPPLELVDSVLPIPGGFMPSASDTSLARRPRSAIIVDEWGPYDYRSPKVWPVDSARALPVRLRALGRPGQWRVTSRRGVASLSAESGAIGDTISVTPKSDSAGDWELTLEYNGAPTVSPRGKRIAAGAPYAFSYGRFEPRIDWTARFYKWADSISDPRKNPNAMLALIQTAPILTEHLSRLDYEGRLALPNLPPENFALEATGSVDLAPGEYTLRTLSDDGIRVWVDSAMVVDNWKSHETALDFATLNGGHHDIRVQYYQGDGSCELRVDIVRSRFSRPAQHPTASVPRSGALPPSRIQF